MDISDSFATKDSLQSKYFYLTSWYRKVREAHTGRKSSNKKTNRFKYSFIKIYATTELKDIN